MAEMIPGQPVGEDIAGLWRQMGNMTRAVTLFDVRLDRIDGDIAELKADVATLRTEVADLKAEAATARNQQTPLERILVDGFDRLDAQLERLEKLIQRNEFKNSPQA